MSHTTWGQVSGIAHNIPVLGRVQLHPTKDTCKTMSCPTGHVSTSMSFPVNDITRMSYPAQQVSYLHVLILIALNIPTHVEFELFLQYIQTSHVDSGLSTAPIISLCQVQSRFPYVLYDMSSPAQQQILQSRRHVVVFEGITVEPDSICHRDHIGIDTALDTRIS